MAARPGFKSVFGPTLYERLDPRLVGYGNPPSDPEYQKANPGSGRLSLVECMIDDDPNNPGQFIQV